MSSETEKKTTEMKTKKTFDAPDKPDNEVVTVTETEEVRKESNPKEAQD
jgi:hypothetical protein